MVVNVEFMNREINLKKKLERKKKKEERRSQVKSSY
jgi:hypothetical protein